MTALLPFSTSVPGALAKWRQELRGGKRGNPDRWTTWPLDDLWKAACKEAVAFESKAAGDAKGAEVYFDWAFLLLHGCHEDPRTPAGRAALERLHPRGGPLTAAPFAGVTPRTGAVWGLTNG